MHGPTTSQPLKTPQGVDTTTVEGSVTSDTAGNGHRESKDIQDQLTDQTNLLPQKKVVICFIGLALCTLVGVLDTVVVAIALPTISAAFTAGSIVSWVPSAYLLTSTSVVALYGRFSDIFGRKATLGVALSIMMVGNLAAGFSKSIEQLIICRGIAGAGGGAIFGLVQIIITDIVSLRERGKYQAIIGTVFAIGSGIGPVIGGAFAQNASWRWCFWSSVPFILLALPVVILVLPLKSVQGNVKQKLLVVDYLGSALTLGACVLILLPLIWGGVTFPWGSPVILATLISGLVLCFLFFLWEYKGAKLPMVPMYIFGYSTVCGVYICGAINGLIQISMTFYLPQFFQVALGCNPIHAALFLIPTLVGQAIFNQIAGQIMSRTGHYRVLIYVGYMIWSVACGFTSTITPRTHQGFMVTLMLFSGVGFGLTQQTMTVAAQASVPRKDMAVVTAFRHFVRMLGGALGLAIGSAILNNTLRASMVQLSLSDNVVKGIVDSPAILSSSGFVGLSSDERAFILNDGYIKGIRRIFILNASLSAFACMTSILLIKHESLTREDDTIRQEAAKNTESAVEAESRASNTNDEKA